MYVTLLEICINMLIKQIFTFKIMWEANKKSANGAENAPK